MLFWGWVGPWDRELGNSYMYCRSEHRELGFWTWAASVRLIFLEKRILSKCDKISGFDRHAFG